MNKRVSVTFSTSGEALRKISIFILVVGILAFFVLLIIGLTNNSILDIIGPAFEVLFGSLFMFAIGKAIASIANYAEAIYKKVNPDAVYDGYLEDGARFFPGEKAHYAGEKEECDVTIENLHYNYGSLVYDCVKESGEKLEANGRMLNPIE